MTGTPILFTASAILSLFAIVVSLSVLASVSKSNTRATPTPATDGQTYVCRCPKGGER